MNGQTRCLKLKKSSLFFFFMGPSEYIASVNNDTAVAFVVLLTNWKQKVKIVSAWMEWCDVMIYTIVHLARVWRKRMWLDRWEETVVVVGTTG